MSFAGSVRLRINDDQAAAIVIRDEFERLFENRLEAATQLAEELLGKTLPRAFRIRLYGPGHPRGEPITTEEALAVLWLGPTVRN